MPENYAPALPQGVPFDEDRLTQWLQRQTLSAQKLITGAVQTGNDIESSNFESGTSGWQIDGDGNAEFNDVTVRGQLQTAAAGSDRIVIGESGGFFNTEAITFVAANGDILGKIDIQDLGAEGKVLRILDQPGGPGYVILNDPLVTSNLMMDTGSRILAFDGEALGPGYTFADDSDTGMWRSASNNLAFAVGGETAVIISEPDSERHRMAFPKAASTYIEAYRTAGGIDRLVLEANDSINSSTIFNDTTSSAATLHIGSNGDIHRSTSSLKYKPDWQWAKDAADYVLPTPIRWTDEEGQVRLGFGAEHIHEAVPEAYETEIYDLRSLVAILSEKIKRLEGLLPA